MIVTLTHFIDWLSEISVKLNQNWGGKQNLISKGRGLNVAK